MAFRAAVYKVLFLLFISFALGGCIEHSTVHDAGLDADSDDGFDADQDVALDADRDAEPDADDAAIDSPCLPDPDADADSDSDGDVESDADVVEDADADADVVSDADISEDADVVEDADADLEIDADHELADCPEDMAAVGAVCVDLYEASRPDATETEQGVATGAARSVAGVIPWHVTPMTDAAFAEFEAACEDAGKRICEPSDWLAACEGPLGMPYVFGDVFDAETCNCVDTFCDDWCADNGVAPGDCETTANCGYTYGCFHVVPTGSFPDCTNEYGTFDMSGNVWEIVPSTTDARGYEVRGGAFNCAGAAARLQCTYNAGWVALYAGFRCCLDR